MQRLRLQFGLKIFLLLPLVIGSFLAGAMMRKQQLLSKQAEALAEVAASRQAFDEAMQAEFVHRLDRSMLRMERADSIQRREQWQGPTP